MRNSWPQSKWRRGILTTFPLFLDWKSKVGWLVGCMVSIASKTFLKWQILVFVRNENLRQTSTQNFMRQSRLPGSEHFLEIENNNQQEKFQIIFAHLINIFQTRKWVSWRWTRGWTRTTRSPAPAPASARWAHTAYTPRIQTRTGVAKLFLHIGLLLIKNIWKGKNIWSKKSIWYVEWSFTFNSLKQS